MTREEKELVFKDLCARLPYHVRCKIWLKDGTTEEGVLDLEHNYADVLRDAFYYNEIKDIKPYLRPLSSMTEDELQRYHELCDVDEAVGVGSSIEIIAVHDTPKSLDYLNSIHVDYRGLIPKGLAISTEGLTSIIKKEFTMSKNEKEVQINRRDERNEWCHYPSH